MLLGGLYSLYLLYLGLMRVMKSPPDKAVGYAVVVVLVAIVVSASRQPHLDAWVWAAA